MQSPNRHQQDLIHLAKNSFFVFTGNILRMILGFCLHVLIIRSIGRAEFGLFSLSLALTSFLTVIAQLGFPQALPRLIAKARVQGQQARIRSFLLTSLLSTLTLSCLLTILLAPQAHILARSFHKPALEPVFKVLIFITPFMALLDLLVAQLRSFEDVWGKVLFKDLLQPALGIGLIGLGVFLAWSFRMLCLSYIASFALAVCVLLLYTLLRVTKKVGRPCGPFRAQDLKDLFSFALPLLGAGLAAQMLIWCDTILLGWFVPAQELGLYNGAFRLARVLTIFLLSGIFIYLPLVSRLIARDELNNVRQIYATLSKWIFLVSLPLLLLMFVDPEMLLRVILGSRYVPAAPVLRLLALGFALHICFGPTAQNTIALGKPQVNFFTLGITLTLNILIDILLIPKYGILGAALALVSSMLVSNVLITWYTHYQLGLHPFSRDYLKILTCTVITAPLLLWGKQSGLFSPFVLTVLSLSCVPAFLLCTRALSEDDLFLCRLILKKIGRSGTRSQAQ